MAAFRGWHYRSRLVDRMAVGAFTEKITAEIVLLRGLTKAEHNSKELVFHYVDTINHYYN